VRVAEGLVEVRSAKGVVFVGGGKQWGCAQEPAPSARASTANATTSATATPTVTTAPPPSAAPLPPARAAKAPAIAHRTVARARPPAPAGTLDEENRLLESALSAERAGDLRQARKLFAQLLTRHPNSPLIPEARLGLARVR
jgi:TolA-binding protein